jgi:type II secretory pathway pseudopilin PulG
MHRSFTRLELLVALILILMFMALIPAAINHPDVQARRTAALSDERQLVAAIQAFYTDYGDYPCETNTAGDENDYFTNGAPGQAKLITILCGAEAGGATGSAITKFNPHQSAYIDVPRVKNASHPRSGIGGDGAWYDPWGNPFLVKIDSNYNGTILNPYSSNAGPAQLKAGVIVWSLGPDGEGATSATGNGDKNTGVFEDDIISWAEKKK